MKFEKDKLEIKPLTPEFRKKNLKILNSVIKESHFLARRNEITKKENEQFIEYYTKLPNTIYLIALYKGKLIGNICALPRPEDLLSHIVAIGYLVDSKYRGNGVCSALMENLIAEAKNREGIKIMIAEVAADNVPSQNILKKYEFNELRRLKDGMMKKEKGEGFVDLLSFSKHF